MAIVGFAVAIPVTLLISGGDDDEPAQPPPTTEAGPPPLGPAERDRGIGVRYQVSDGWRQEKKASAIRLRSPDRNAQIVIASPAPASESESVLDDALAALRSGYEDVDVTSGSGPRLGGLRTKGAVARVRTREGARLRVLVAVTKGERRAYLVEVFTAADAAPERIREAQVTLNSLKFLN
jgi:carbamate kinase